MTETAPASLDANEVIVIADDALFKTVDDFAAGRVTPPVVHLLKAPLRTSLNPREQMERDLEALTATDPDDAMDWLVAFVDSHFDTDPLTLAASLIQACAKIVGWLL